MGILISISVTSDSNRKRGSHAWLPLSVYSISSSVSSGWNEHPSKIRMVSRRPYSTRYHLCRWYVFQCKMSHSYHWSHSDTRYLLRYTAKVSRTAEIAPTGELPSGFARQYAGRLLDCPIPFRYTAGYSAYPAVPTEKSVPSPYFTPAVSFPHRPVRANLLPARIERHGPVRSAILTIAWLFSYS